MSYQIAERGVIDLASGAVVLPGSDAWAVYEKWLREGGKPQPATIRRRWSDLTAARAEWRAALRLERARREAAGFAFRTRTIDSDTAARARLFPAIAAALAATVLRTAYARDWTTGDGSRLALDAAGMLALAAALADHDNDCAARAAELKTQIDAAADFAALDSIDITGGWPT